MICDACRITFACIHLTDADYDIHLHYCLACCPGCDGLSVVDALKRWRDRAPPAWFCAVCDGGVDTAGPSRIVKAPDGMLWYTHVPCFDVAFDGVLRGRGYTVPGLGRVTRVAAATPEVAAALGMPYEEPSPEAKAAMAKRYEPCTCAVPKQCAVHGRCRDCGKVPGGK